MNQIISSVFAEISRCSHPWHMSASKVEDVRVRGDGSLPFRACIDSKAESLALTAISLLERNPGAVDKHREEVKRLVGQAISDCVDSLEEVGYETQGWSSIQQCITQRGDRLVDMAMDMFMGDSEEVEVKKKTIRCSRRKKSSHRERSRMKKSSGKRVTWKK